MTGKKLDDDKPRIDLVTPEFIEAVAEVMSFGAVKYTAHNWRGGINYSRCYAALLRHILAWQRGEDKDPESGLPHLAHAACSIMFLLTFESDGRKELDDRYNGGPAPAPEGVVACACTDVARDPGE